MKSFQPIVNCIILMMALVLNAACSASDEEDVMTSNQTTLAKATPAITRASSTDVNDSASLTISFQAYGNNGEAISQIDPNTTVSVKDVKISAIMNTTDGQTHTTTLTTGNDNTVYLHVVPGTGSVQITATYAVRTIDKNLAKGYCETESTVTETLSDKTFLAGHSYSFAIGLNLSSLQFSANTNGWG
jgi:hypothetical protein